MFFCTLTEITTQKIAVYCRYWKRIPNISSVGPSSERNIEFFYEEKPQVSLWRRANAQKCRLRFLYRQYTDLFIFRFVFQHCLRSTLRLLQYSDFMIFNKFKNSSFKTKRINSFHSQVHVIRTPSLFCRTQRQPRQFHVFRTTCTERRWGCYLRLTSARTLQLF